MGTIRTLSDRTAAQVEERITQIARGLSAASRTTIDVAFQQGTEAVVNDPEVTAICVRAAGEVVGESNVEEIRLPSMGGEDFSGYFKHVPGCLLRLGVASLDRPRHALHSAHFDIDEAALAIGARTLAHGAVLLSIATQEPPVVSLFKFVANERPSLGVEIELNLVDSQTMALRSAISEILAELPAGAGRLGQARALAVLPRDQHQGLQRRR